MGLKKYLILILVFYFLVILQTSFLAHFAILGNGLNFVLILVFLLNFFQIKKSPKSFGIIAGALGGLILDLSSALPFATLFLTLGLLGFLVKKLGVLLHKSNLFSLFLIFLFSFLFYKFFSSLLGGGINFLFNKDFNPAFPVTLAPLVLEFLYNFVFVLLGFLIVKKYAILEE